MYLYSRLVCVCSIAMSTLVSIYLPIYLTISVYLSVYLSTYLSVYLSIYVSTRTHTHMHGLHAKCSNTGKHKFTGPSCCSWDRHKRGPCTVDTTGGILNSWEIISRNSFVKFVWSLRPLWKACGSGWTTSFSNSLVLVRGDSPGWSSSRALSRAVASFLKIRYKAFNSRERLLQPKGSTTGSVNQTS